MRLLIIDAEGHALDFAIRAQRDGHEVKHFIRDREKTKHIGLGFVPIIREFEPWWRWADLIFNTDNTLYLRQMDAYRKDGANVIGASQESAEWELDREVGQQILKVHGVPTIPFKVFNDYDKAIAHVKRTDARCVSKPSGDADKALSYCASTPADMVYMLERWKKGGKLKGEFIIQEFIPGTEMAVGGWFGPGGFNEAWCENFEFKKLMNDDLGVATGEQGTVLRYTKTSKLARKVLEPLTETLLKLDYCGYIDVNTIIDAQGTPWPLEFTMRPGWPTFNIQTALHKGDCVEWLMDLVHGVDARNTSLDEVAIGVVLSIPDYPYSHLTRKEVTGVPIYGLTDALWANTHPCEMMMGEAPDNIGGSIKTIPMPVTAGDYVLVMTGTGETVLQAKHQAYRHLKRLTVPNSPMWRTDIGSRLRSQLPAIQTHGYAKGLVYSETTANSKS